ncbi:MAG: hypothetical protein U5K28_05910 [Halobacteriales archaeon]|nr:hypothetical protein [Halobacteriales archaeon]
MKRRAVLGSVAAGLLAGCQSGNSESSSSRSPTPADTFATDSGNRLVVEKATIDGSSAEQTSGPPISLRATVTDERLDQTGARLRVTVHNKVDDPVILGSGPPAPFGVLRYRPRDRQADPGRVIARLLWSPAYRESDMVTTDGHDVTGSMSPILRTPIEPDGMVSRTFTVTDSPPPGRYVATVDLGYTVGTEGDDRPSGTAACEVGFRVERP